MRNSLSTWLTSSTILLHFTWKRDFSAWNVQWDCTVTQICFPKISYNNIYFPLSINQQSTSKWGTICCHKDFIQMFPVHCEEKTGNVISLYMIHLSHKAVCIVYMWQHTLVLILVALYVFFFLHNIISNNWKEGEGWIWFRTLRNTPVDWETPDKTGSC